MSIDGVDIRQIGVITEVKRGIIKLSGLPSCIMGQLIELGHGARGFVIGFTDTEVLALTLGQESELAVGQKVDVRQQPLRIPVGEQLIGRVVSPLGEVLDGGKALSLDNLRPMFYEAPGIMARHPVERQLCTGIRVIDALIPIGKGQRELIIGDRMTGKTTLALDVILSQRSRGVVCIYCCIGQSQNKLQQVIQLFQENKIGGYTIVVAAPASHPASEQFLAPYAACAMGEYFMYQGKDVLVVFDDLSKHAWAYRQLSLLLERPPGREAYPGDMFFIHAQFMERAAQLNEERSGGSMTFLPICETQQGDVTGYICSNLISMTDGQIYLSGEMFYEGTKPAVDVGLSVSRIGSKVQPHLLRDVSGMLRLELLQYMELMRLSRFASSHSEEMIRRQKHGELVRRIMTQPAHQPMGWEDQALLLYAMKKGYLEKTNEEGIRFCLAGLFTRMPENVKQSLQQNEPLTPVIYARLDAGLDEILKPFMAVKQEAANAVAKTVA